MPIQTAPVPSGAVERAEGSSRRVSPIVLVSTRPANAVEQGGLWVVPASQEPQLDGSAIDVYLTGPGTCP